MALKNPKGAKIESLGPADIKTNVEVISANGGGGSVKPDKQQSFEERFLRRDFGYFYAPEDTDLKPYAFLGCENLEGLDLRNAKVENGGFDNSVYEELVYNEQATITAEEYAHPYAVRARRYVLKTEGNGGLSPSFIASCDSEQQLEVAYFPHECNTKNGLALFAYHEASANMWQRVIRLFTPDYQEIYGYIMNFSALADYAEQMFDSLDETLEGFVEMGFYDFRPLNNFLKTKGLTHAVHFQIIYLVLMASGYASEPVALRDKWYRFTNHGIEEVDVEYLCSFIENLPYDEKEFEQLKTLATGEFFLMTRMQEADDYGLVLLEDFSNIQGLADFYLNVYKKMVAAVVNQQEIIAYFQVPYLNENGEPSMPSFEPNTYYILENPIRGKSVNTEPSLPLFKSDLLNSIAEKLNSFLRGDKQ